MNVEIGSDSTTRVTVDDSTMRDLDGDAHGGAVSGEFGGLGGGEIGGGGSDLGVGGRGRGGCCVRGRGRCGGGVDGERLAALAARMGVVAIWLSRLIRDGTAGEAKVVEARTSIIGNLLAAAFATPVDVSIQGVVAREGVDIGGGGGDEGEVGWREGG